MSRRGPHATTGARWMSRLAGLATLAAIALAAWWALGPLASVEPIDANLAEAPSDPVSARPVHLALDTRPFSTPLWVAPPAPPPSPKPEPPPPPPPPPPPLKLQLVAIVREPGIDGAAAIAGVLLYDPDADRLLSLREGDTLDGGRTIVKITDAEVQVREPDRRDGRPGVVRTLALNNQPGAAGGVP